MNELMLIFALLSSALAQDGRLANGVYAVEKGRAAGKNSVVRQYEGRDVVLDTANFAPLAVEGKPEVHPSPSGGWLAVQLAPEAAGRLENLTRSQLNQPIAVVVGDRIVSAPIVRSVITDGKARVTPCDGRACETLLRELTK